MMFAPVCILLLAVVVTPSLAGVCDVCQDVITASQDINGGEVFNVAKCGKRYQLTNLDDANIICKKHGAVLATPAQLTAAHKAGMSVCYCGWLSDGTAKWPMGPVTKAGCGKANAINDCPASAMGKWNGPGWNVFCYKSSCENDIRATQKIAVGEVFNVAKCGLRYQLKTQAAALEVCNSYGAVLASPAQLNEAHKAGMSVCRCGWLSDGTAAWPMGPVTSGGCGKANQINQCPHKYMGSWGGPGWNAFCHKDCDHEIKASQKIASGEVFNVAKCGKRYQMTNKDQAAALCKVYGAVLASPAQLKEAHKAGMSVCHCGWMSDGTAAWPMGPVTKGGCGKANFINPCPPKYMGSWGGPGWNALCFK